MGADIGVRMLWVVSGGFLLGIFLRSLFALPTSFAAFIALVALATLFLPRSKGNRQLWVIFVALLATSIGIVRMDAGILRGDPALDARIGTPVELTGYVSAEPDVRDASVRIAVRANVLASSTEKISATLLVVLPAYTDVSYGDSVRIRGTLRLPEAFDSGTGRKFDYPGYLASRGIAYELERVTLIERTHSGGNLVIAAALHAKDAVVSGLERALPEPHAGLASGITVGEKRALGSEVTDEFRTVSLIHIIVLSGYNIAVVITYLSAALEYTHASRYARFGLGVLVAVFFAVMTGFSSASLRAALMAVISISGQLSNRVYRPERALAVVAVAMVAWNPYLLVFDPGFQLSFLATAGLILFSERFEELYARVPRSFLLRDTLVATSSAQVSVLPLILYGSGGLSVVGMLANVMVLPVIPIAMAFSMIAAIAGVVIPAGAPLIGLPAHVLLTYTLSVAKYLSSFPFASVEVPAFSGWLLIPVYGALFWFARSRPSTNTAPEAGAVQRP